MIRIKQVKAKDPRADWLLQNPVGVEKLDLSKLVEKTLR
jgi:hypothetical protein